MMIGGLQKFSTIDFPGKIASVLFTKGCNLNCFYCHNRELISTSSSGSTISKDEVFDFLRRRRGLVDGVVISGGEPTIQGELPLLISEIAALGYAVKLDTNGKRPDVLASLLKDIDYIALDFKTPQAAAERVCGDADLYPLAIEAANILLAGSTPFEVRTTLYPGLTLEEFIEMLRALPEVPCYRVNYFKMPRLHLLSDETVLARTALTRNDLLAHETHLRQYQPNLVL